MLTRTDKRISTVIIATAVMISMILLLSNLRLNPTKKMSTSSPLGQGDYTVVIENDYEYPVTVTAFATFELSPTVYSLGLITAGQSTTFTLAPGKDVYTFNTVTEENGQLGYHSSVISEERLIDRNFHVKLMEDDMQGAAIPATYLPPTPTYEPVLTPTPTACSTIPC